MTADPKVLIVFYSRTGRTREIAYELAEELGADFEELEPAASWKGLPGLLRLMLGSALGARPILLPLSHDPYLYDAVIVGSPNCGGSVASPVRAFLSKHRSSIHNAAFFQTGRSRGKNRVFWQMSSLCGKRPLATVAISDQSFCGGDPGEKVGWFVVKLLKSWTIRNLESSISHAAHRRTRR